MEQKQKMITRIVDDYLEYMNYLGVGGEITSSDNSVVLTLTKKGSKPYFHALIWKNSTNEGLENKINELQQKAKYLVVIFFSSEQLKNIKANITLKTTSLFDLESKFLYGELNEYTIDLRVFFQRFGITFDY